MIYLFEPSSPLSLIIAFGVSRYIEISQEHYNVRKHAQQLDLLSSKIGFGNVFVDSGNLLEDYLGEFGELYIESGYGFVDIE